MPPNEGIAMGSMISDPRPVLDNTGNRAKMVVAVVIMAGLTLRKPPATTASLMPVLVDG